MTLGSSFDRLVSELADFQEHRAQREQALVKAQAQQTRSAAPTPAPAPTSARTSAPLATPRRPQTPAPAPAPALPPPKPPIQRRDGHRAPVPQRQRPALDFPTLQRRLDRLLADQERAADQDKAARCRALFKQLDAQARAGKLPALDAAKLDSLRGRAAAIGLFQ